LLKELLTLISVVYSLPPEPRGNRTSPGGYLKAHDLGFFSAAYHKPMPLSLDPPLFEDLALLESYEYYDRPLLFSCFEQTSYRLFLAVLINEHNATEEWLYVEVSRQRLLNIRAGLISLHDAFARSENGFVFRVWLSTMDAEIARFEVVSSEELLEHQLPMQGERLNLITPLRQLPKSSISGSFLLPFVEASRPYAARSAGEAGYNMPTESQVADIRAPEKVVIGYFNNFISQDVINNLTFRSRNLEEECRSKLLNKVKIDDAAFVNFLRENLSKYSRGTFTKALRANTIDEIRVAFKTMLSVAPAYKNPDEVIAIGRRDYLGATILSEILGLSYPKQYLAKTRSTEFGVLMISRITSQSVPVIEGYSDFISLSYKAWDYVSGEFRRRGVTYDNERRFWYVYNVCEGLRERTTFS
jgi:hypothetical protein